MKRQKLASDTRRRLVTESWKITIFILYAVWELWLRLVFWQPPVSRLPVFILSWPTIEVRQIKFISVKIINGSENEQHSLLAGIFFTYKLLHAINWSMMFVDIELFTNNS